MRDILTALAGAVILILIAAVAVPPFIDWAEHRAVVDTAISRSVGLTARSEGRIEIRLLPFPRLRLDRLRLGEEADQPALDLRIVKAELALAPLLKGEVRFTETRVGRAEVRLAVTEGDALLLPRAPAEGRAGADLVIDDLQVQQFLITTQVAATGRTDQIYAEAVRLRAPALVGPWQIEGTSGGTPFRLTTGAIDGQGVRLKLSGGGDGRPRFEADARVTLTSVGTGKPAGTGKPSGTTRAVIPEAEGSARLVVGPPIQAEGVSLPYTLAGTFKTDGASARFEGVTAEIDPGGKALRLAGTGRLDLREGRGALDLDARRLDLDGFLASPAGQGLIERGMSADGLGLPIRLDLGLTIDSLTLGGEDWSDLRSSVTFDRSGGLLLRRFSATAPGASALSATGELDTAPALRFSGHVDLDAPRSDGIGRTLDQLGLAGPWAGWLDGRPIRAATDLAAAGPVVSFTNLRLGLGETTLTGNGSLTRGGPGTRERIDAQIAVRGLDIAELPSAKGAMAGLDRYDLGLTIQARDVRSGPAGPHSGNGTLAASLRADGAGLVIDRFEIADVAGATATLSGRIAPDGSERVAGHISAPVAAPLLALAERLWLPDAALVPAVLRTSPLDLDVALVRDGAEALRASARGRAARGDLDLAVLARSGRVASFEASLATAETGGWFGRDDIAGLRKPGRLSVNGTRSPAGAEADASFQVTVSGTLADLALATDRPILLEAGSRVPAGGVLKARTPDLAPYLVLMGSAPSLPVLPADLTIAFARGETGAAAAIDGRIGGAAASARLLSTPDGRLSGTASVERLSLPGLAAALILPTTGPGGPNLPFGPEPRPMPAEIDLTVARLELGRDLTAERAGFHLALERDALTLRDLRGTLAGGGLAGAITVTRNGGSATISGEGRLSGAALTGLVGDGPVKGRISARLRGTGTGESWVGLAANLAGNGEITLSDLVLPGADPGALDRSLERALAEDDPLREGRLQGLLAEELAKGPLTVTSPLTTPVTLGAGLVRTGPFALDLGAASWAGTMGIDLGRGRLDARGTLRAKDGPEGWSGAAPAIQLGFAGALSAPERQIDGGALSNGLAALVLQRELEKIELFEADQSERERRRARIEMDRARAGAIRAAAEETARRARLAAEEAARQARLREEEVARRAPGEGQGAPAGLAPDADPRRDARQPAPQP